MSSKALRKVIIGKEAVPGDGATPDVALRAVASLKAVPDKIQPDEDIGSFAPSRHYIGSLKAEGGLEYDGYYEHAPYPVSMALGAGAVVITGDPEVWTWTLADGTAPTFATYRMEYTDGADHIVRADDVFATDIEIKGEAGQSWMITNTLVGGSTTFPAALGASLTPPATVNPILMARTLLYMDALFANIGTTEVPVLISFTWKLESLQHQKLFAGSLFPSGRGHDKWKITLDLIVEAEEDQIEALKGTLLTTDTTAIRIEEITPDAGGAGVDWNFQINGSYYLDQIDTIDERDGNNTLKMSFVGQKDVLGNSGSIVIGNSLQAL